MQSSSPHPDREIVSGSGSRSISHCMSVKSAFAACRRLTAQFPLRRATYRRALKRRVFTLKHREEKAMQDQLALLKSRRQNYLDSIASDLGVRILRVA
ncbi:hypothetical protein LCGC14_0275820 [marine sediment metagenome]|uniref:Uncharacterized protein n=1 Tax=marine sediment metagenome TaxID=412755 RepID=A0A0F9TXP6_9ZZZZ